MSETEAATFFCAEPLVEGALLPRNRKCDMTTYRLGGQSAASTELASSHFWSSLNSGNLAVLTSIHQLVRERLSPAVFRSTSKLVLRLLC